MLRLDRSLNNRSRREDEQNDDFFGGDLVLKERSRNDRSLDRFIPKKIEKRLFTLNPKMSNEDLAEIKSKESGSEDFNKKLINQLNKEQFEDILESNLILSAEKNHRKGWTERKVPNGRKLFCYSTNKKSKNSLHEDIHLISFERKRETHGKLRKIDCTPSKVLDAPGMEDDFYKQVLEWTEKNLLLVALQDMVYSWLPDTNATDVVFTNENKDDKVSALRADSSGRKLAVGTQAGQLLLVDLEEKTHSQLTNNCGRISCIDMYANQIAVGCKEKGLMLVDWHIKKEVDLLESLNLPFSEICGIKFSPNGNYLAAGANDNRFIVIDIKSMKVVINSMEHKAAVRAIAWNPRNPNIVASGGGRKDKCINFWSVASGRLEKKIETDSQVCGLSFSKSTDEFLSTHGFSNNNIQIWETKTYAKLAELTGHTERVLYHALNPEGTTLVTSSADETLRFWDVFPKPEEPRINKSVFYSLLNLR